jgi:hypothetical protein
VYYITDPQIDVSIPLYTLTPSSCPYQLTYSASLADGSALPASITLHGSDSNSFIRLSSSDPTALGEYTVKITAVDPVTEESDDTLTFKVTIFCTKSFVVVTNPIPAVTTYTIDTVNL